MLCASSFAGAGASFESVRRVWVIRVGEGAANLDALRAAGIIGLRYEHVGDARTLTPQQIEQAIGIDHAEGLGQMRSWLMRFVSDVGAGDLIVIPNMADHEMWLAIVTGAYEFAAEPVVGDIAHTRTVDWLSWLDRGSPWLQHKLKYIDVPGDIVELRDVDWWFEQVATIDLPTNRPERWRRPAPPAPLPRKRSAAPKPVPAAKPTVPERALCGGSCGFQWSTAVLVGGLCPDCRGD